MNERIRTVFISIASGYKIKSQQNKTIKKWTKCFGSICWHRNHWEMYFKIYLIYHLRIIENKQKENFYKLIWSIQIFGLCSYNLEMIWKLCESLELCCFTLERVPFECNGKCNVQKLKKQKYSARERVNSIIVNFFFIYITKIQHEQS